jgi:hypothetical protein
MDLRSDEKSLTRPLHDPASSDLPPDLAHIVRVWASLPEHVRLAIMALAGLLEPSQ